MVNNSTNINKTNNNLSPQLIQHKKTMTYDVRNPGKGLEQAQKMWWHQTDANIYL